MIFSVWNQAAGEFDYYENSTTQDVLNVERPSHLVSRALGSTVDQAAWPLPSDVQRIGSGSCAVGRVASRGGSSLGADDSGSGMVKNISLLAAGVVAAWVMSKRGKP